jgi:hypothetical protein
MGESLIHPSLLYTGLYNVSKYITSTYEPDRNLVKPSYSKVKKKRGRDIFIPSTDPLDFAEYRRKYDLEEINSRLLSSNMDEEEVDRLGLDPKFTFEIKRTIYALKAWEKTPGKKGYEKEEIMRDTLLLGPSYAKKLSDEWDYGIRRKMVFPIFGRSYENWRPMINYNYLPPVQYLIRWSEETDDIKYMQLPLDPFNKDYMREFEETLYHLLPDDITLPNDMEILSITKTSTSYSFEDGKSIPMFKARQSPEGKSFTQTFKAVRSIVPVGPANTRDAVVTSIDTFNSMKWCDLVILEVLNEFDTSLINSSSSTFRKRLKKMTKMPQNKKIFYHRDIRKAGLTFPRELFNLVQDTLARKYPDKDFSRFNIYRNYSIYKDNKPFETVRGYCLGMANNLITLCQCIVFEMINERVGQQLKLKGLFGNDDSIIRMNVDNWTTIESDCYMLETWDRDICQGLNIMLHNEKTFWSLSPVIYEEYGDPDLTKKDSRLACALSGAYLAPNIKYAKCMVNALSPLFTGAEWEHNILNEIISYWGYEYYPSECYYDYQLGGWSSHRSYHCSTVMREVENMDQCDYAGAYKAILSIRAFQKALMKPGTSSSITENYSVLGKIHGIYWVSEDTEDFDKHLPRESLFLSKEDYNVFYEILYEFSRRPLKFLSFVDKRTPKIRIPKNSIDKMALRILAQSLKGPKAIPEYLVTSTTSLWNKNEVDPIDLPFMWYRNGISRYIQHLKNNKIIFSEADIHEHAGDEFLYTSEYDTCPYHGDDVFRYEALDGKIPRGIYQFSSNPWLPINEYAQSFDVIPTDILILWDDKIHPDEQFLKTDPRDEEELGLTRVLIPWLGLDETNEILSFRRQYRAGKKEDYVDMDADIEFCDDHVQKQLNTGWDEDRLIFQGDEFCQICQYVKSYCLVKIVGNTHYDEEVRLENRTRLSLIKSGLSTLCKMLDYSDKEIEEVLDGPPDIFDLEESGSEGGGLFGFDDF